MTLIEEIGQYWEVNSDNCIINNHKDLELLPIAENIKNLFLQEVFIHIPYIHSVYLSGSYLTGKVYESSDINFLVVVDNKVNVDNLENETDLLKQLIEDLIQKKLNSKIIVNINIQTLDFSKFDLLISRFMTKCVWGEDISLENINFDLIDKHILDGLEKEDQKYLKNTLNELIFVVENLKQDEIFFVQEKIKNHLKLILRCSFNSICKKIKIWTRDLYYCNYFFSKENPDLSHCSTQCLDLYLNINKEKKDILNVLYDANKLIDYVCSC